MCVTGVLLNCPSYIEVLETDAFVEISCERLGDLNIASEVRLTSRSTIPQEAEGTYSF